MLHDCASAWVRLIVSVPHDRPPLSKQVLSGAWDVDRVWLTKDEKFDALDAAEHLGDRARFVRVVHDGGEVLAERDALHPAGNVHFGQSARAQQGRAPHLLRFALIGHGHKHARAAGHQQVRAPARRQGTHAPCTP